MDNQKNALLVLGGTWHKFDEFEADFRPLLAGRGLGVECTRDLASLERLKGTDCDLVVMYTCLSGTLENGQPATTLMRDSHAEPLRQWVSAGGMLLLIHSACVACQTSDVMRKLAGGVFVNHPPAMSFMVYPMFTDHPIVADIPAFTVYDEFYIERTEPDVNVHMIATHIGKAYPMVWSRREGLGRVAHIAMGHDEQVWRLPPYRKLVGQAIDWLLPPP